MKVTVNVTREHFDRALASINKPSNPYSECCVLAQALKDAGFVEPRVSFTSFYDRELTEFGSVSLPPAAINTRQAFDNCNGRTFVPCSFDVEIEKE